MLALLTGLGDAPADQTFVFDEIDAGIGGQTARAVGERLRALGADRQVICITHLPQVASPPTVTSRSTRTPTAARRCTDVLQPHGDERRRASSAACSAPTPTTAAPESTRASCLRPLALKPRFIAVSAA